MVAEKAGQPAQREQCSREPLAGEPPVPSPARSASLQLARKLRLAAGSKPKADHRSWSSAGWGSRNPYL